MKCRQESFPGESDLVEFSLRPVFGPGSPEERSGVRDNAPLCCAGEDPENRRHDCPSEEAGFSVRSFPAGKATVPCAGTWPGDPAWFCVAPEPKRRQPSLGVEFAFFSSCCPLKFESLLKVFPEFRTPGIGL